MITGIEGLKNQIIIIITGKIINIQHQIGQDQLVEVAVEEEEEEGSFRVFETMVVRLS